MENLFSRWYHRNFSDPQAIILVVLLLASFLMVYTLSEILAPVFVAIVLAYLLESVVTSLEQKKVARNWSVIIVFVGFITLALALILGVVPAIWHQAENLVEEIPTIIEKVKQTLETLLAKYPSFISPEQVNGMFEPSKDKEGGLGEFIVSILSVSLSSLVSFAAILVYLILVPLMLFFFLKDKDQIIKWNLNWLPKERRLANKVWSEVDSQIGNYIRGKVVEIFIVGGVSFIVLSFFDLRYALLLSVLVGFSVLIPYIGAAVVTIPIALVAYVQWGFEAQFAYVIIAYAIIQALDGNVLVPILFSEAVNLHPVAIIIAVLFFGGIWGFWGVFFAIPLATVVKAVINAWGDVNTGEQASS
ncbi:MAG: AI-2E family transporter [Kangiellaceae bacterium]|jgi:putative permease|nr:AI-2E family transporter [Kangiellaceae bacterium]